MKFAIKIPPTKKFKVWIAATGGHCDHITVVYNPPSDWHPRKKTVPGEKELERPESGVLRFGTGEFVNWFCDGKPDALIAMGLVDADCKPFSVDIEKWVKAELELPCEECEGTAYGIYSRWDYVYGLDIHCWTG